MLFPVFFGSMNGSESHDKQDGRARHCSDAALSLCADQVNVAGLLVCFFLLHDCIWVADYGTERYRIPSNNPLGLELDCGT
jgi:hypothetical protein